MIVFFALLAFLELSPSSPLDKVRTTFFEAGESKQKTAELLKITVDASLEREPVRYAYHGVATAMWAVYEFNPLHKLSSFNKGKTKLEKAIRANPRVLELRFLRFTLQSKAPSMLGYQTHINEDKTFIINHLVAVKNKDLSNNYCRKVVDFLLNSDLCTQEEKKKLKTI